MSTTFQGPPGTDAEAAALLAAGGPSAFAHEDAAARTTNETTGEAANESTANESTPNESTAAESTAAESIAAHSIAAGSHLETTAALTLASLHVGARLVLRCRKDWRVATVASFEEACVRLNVASPSGHTYRVRRPADAALTYEGAIPLLGQLTPAGWRAALARYDARW